MTYAELSTAIGVWTGRTGDTAITGNMALIVSMAEAKLSRRLVVRQMIGRSTASIDDEYSAVPADFVGVRTFFLEDRQLRFVTPDQADALAAIYTSAATPTHYTVAGEEFRFIPSPAATGTGTLTYFKSLPPLSTNSTNWLLTAHPDIYVYACCLEVELMKFDDAGIARFGMLLEVAVDDLNLTEHGVSGPLTPIASTVV